MKVKGITILKVKQNMLTHGYKNQKEKTLLLEELKEFLETVSLTEKSKAEAEEAEANQQVLNKSPLGIYIG